MVTQAMNTSLICTFIGEDKPGLVKLLAEAINNCNGNWLESSMAQLAGYFAGIVRIQIEAAEQQKLVESLQTLSGSGLNVQVMASDSETTMASETRLFSPHQLSIVGNDRPGIVHEITQALSNRGINVLEMNTHLSSAAMSGDPLFHSSMSLAVPETVNLDELQTQLDNIAAALSIEIDLEQRDD